MEKVKITLKMYCSPCCRNCEFAREIGDAKYECLNCEGKKHWIDNAKNTPIAEFSIRV